MPSKGVLILYSNSAQLDYYKLSKLCSRLAEQYLNVPCTIQYIEPEQTNFRTFRYPENTLEKTEWNNIGRFSALDLSPYDETILLDSDYIVQSNTLTNYFGCDHDFICHNKSWDVTGNDVFRHDQYMTQNKFEMRWATVIYFKKSEQNKIFFDLTQHIQENWDHYNSIFQVNKGIFRNDHVFSIAIHIMNGYQKGDFAHKLPGIKYYTADRDILWDLEDDNFFFLLEKQNHLGEYTPLRIKGSSVHVMNKFSLNRIIDKGEM